MPAFTMDMDRYGRLPAADKRAVEQWVDIYVDMHKCFRFDLAEDGGSVAVRFYLYDLDKRVPGVAEVPSHTVDVFGVAPCPVT